jgi:hypothetical protein
LVIGASGFFVGSRRNALRTARDAASRDDTRPSAKKLRPSTFVNHFLVFASLIA